MSATSRGQFRTLAANLEQLIRVGEWQVNEKLPSIRGIAQQYNVALATASRALEVLHGKGLIRPHERSGVYLVAEAPVPATAASCWAVCLRVTPGPWQRGAMAVVSTGFMELARTPGVRLDFEAIPTDLDQPRDALPQLVQKALQAGITGLFLLPSRINEAQLRQDELLLEACRKCGLPVVLIERNLRGEHRPLECDLVCPDDLDGGFQCAMHLLQEGRTRLAFVRGGPTSSHNDMLAGYLRAHFQARQQGLLPPDQDFPLVLEYPEGSAGKEAYRILCEQILDAQIDGVVCYQDRVVIGLAIELLARGKRIPDDVALTGFDDQAIGQEFTIGVTTYAFPSREIASRAFQMMRERISNPAAPPTKVLVPSRLIVRESSAGTRRG